MKYHLSDAAIGANQSTFVKLNSSLAKKLPVFGVIDFSHFLRRQVEDRLADHLLPGRAYTFLKSLVATQVAAGFIFGEHRQRNHLCQGF